MSSSASRWAKPSPTPAPPAQAVNDTPVTPVQGAAASKWATKQPAPAAKPVLPPAAAAPLITPRPPVPSVAPTSTTAVPFLSADASILQSDAPRVVSHKSRGPRNKHKGKQAQQNLADSTDAKDGQQRPQQQHTTPSSNSVPSQPQVNSNGSSSNNSKPKSRTKSPRPSISHKGQANGATSPPPPPPPQVSQSRRQSVASNNNNDDSWPPKKIPLGVIHKLWDPKAGGFEVAAVVPPSPSSATLSSSSPVTTSATSAPLNDDWPPKGALGTIHKLWNPKENSFVDSSQTVSNSTSKSYEAKSEALPSPIPPRKPEEEEEGDDELEDGDVDEKEDPETMLQIEVMIQSVSLDASSTPAKPHPSTRPPAPKRSVSRSLPRPPAVPDSPEGSPTPLPPSTAAEIPEIIACGQPAISEVDVAPVGSVEPRTPEKKTTTIEDSVSETPDTGRSKHSTGIDWTIESGDEEEDLPDLDEWGVSLDVNGVDESTVTQKTPAWSKSSATLPAPLEPPSSAPPVPVVRELFATTTSSPSLSVDSPSHLRNHSHLPPGPRQNPPLLGARRPGGHPKNQPRQSLHHRPHPAPPTPKPDLFADGLPSQQQKQPSPSPQPPNSFQSQRSRQPPKEHKRPAVNTNFLQRTLGANTTGKNDPGGGISIRGRGTRVAPPVGLGSAKEVGENGKKDLFD